jgi:hypothetical protein
MRYLKRFNESIDIDTIKDILLELEDAGFTIEINSRRLGELYKEITISFRTSKHNGGLMGFEFIWRDVKDTIFRLMNFYYSENEKPKINNNKIILSNKEKMNFRMFDLPLRLFGHIRNGFAASDKMIEFGIGFTSKEDFDNAKDNYIIGDYTIFEKIKILVK